MYQTSSIRSHIPAKRVFDFKSRVARVTKIEDTHRILDNLLHSCKLTGRTNTVTYRLAEHMIDYFSKNQFTHVSSDFDRITRRMLDELFKGSFTTAETVETALLSYTSDSSDSESESVSVASVSSFGSSVSSVSSVRVRVYPGDSSDTFNTVPVSRTVPLLVEMNDLKNHHPDPTLAENNERLLSFLMDEYTHVTRDLHNQIKQALVVLRRIAGTSSRRPSISPPITPPPRAQARAPPPAPRKRRKRSYPAGSRPEIPAPQVLKILQQMQTMMTNHPDLHDPHTAQTLNSHISHLRGGCYTHVGRSFYNHVSEMSFKLGQMRARVRRLG